VLEEANLVQRQNFEIDPSLVRQVLLIRRGNEPQKGMLTFPGGSLELGETMVACAVRETFEETGLRLRNRAQGKFFHDPDGAPECVPAKGAQPSTGDLI
jgi:ADP-ribose pyrophosphatase YjhB (NUDIX family)